MPSTPGRRASAVKQPCESCKEKHVKCDDGRPRCGRCQAKSLQCVRKTRPTSFRPGSSARYDARFTGNEHWVSGSTVQCKFGIYTNSCVGVRRLTRGAMYFNANIWVNAILIISNPSLVHANYEFSQSSSNNQEKSLRVRQPLRQMSLCRV